MRRVGLTAGMLMMVVAVPALAQQGQPRAGGAGQQARARQSAAMFQRLDKNHDGGVSRDEWRRSDQAFARLDVDKDGALSNQELRRAATPRQFRALLVRARVAQRRLRRMDVNRDRTIARDEWRGKPEAFDRLDADKDGRLTAAEIRQRRPRRAR